MTTRPPKDLAAAGRRLWRSITQIYDLSPAEMALLERACKTSDRLSRLDELITQTGPLVRGSVNQLRASPLWAQLAEQERILAMQIRMLALPDPAEQVEQGQAEWRNRRRRGHIA